MATSSIVIKVEGPIHSIPLWSAHACREWDPHTHCAWECKITIEVTMDFSKVKLKEGEKLYLVQQTTKNVKRIYTKSDPCDVEEKPFMDLWALPSEGATVSRVDKTSQNIFYNFEVCGESSGCRLECDREMDVFVAKISKKADYEREGLEEDRDRAMTQLGTVAGSRTVRVSNGEEVKDPEEQTIIEYGTDEDGRVKVDPDNPRKPVEEYPLPTVAEFYAANNVTLVGAKAGYKIYPKIAHCAKEWHVATEIKTPDGFTIPATLDDKGRVPMGGIKQLKEGEPVPTTKGTVISDATSDREYNIGVVDPRDASEYREWRRSPSPRWWISDGVLPPSPPPALDAIQELAKFWDEQQKHPDFKDID